MTQAAAISPSPERGARLRTLGAALFWIGVVGMSIPLAFRSLMPWWALLASTYTLGALCFVGIAIRRRGRKLLARAQGPRIAELDSRPPVVYLRSFDADDQGAGVVNSWPLLKFGYVTEEEQLAIVMNEIGPFVAIGDPRESLPDLGAARIYVGDGDWHRKVADLLSHAALVILRAGTSDGFLWELGVVRASMRPERLLILVPADNALYDRFRGKAAAILPHPLPDFPRGKRLMGRTAAVLAFDGQWRPSILPVVRPFARSQFTAPYLAGIKFTLRPIFDRLGVRWAEPPVARGRLITIGVCAAIAALFGLLWLALVIPEFFSTPATDTSHSRSPAPAAPSDSAYDLALEEFSARTAAMPELRELLPAMDRTAAGEFGRVLATKGLLRLDDDAVVRRATLMQRILQEADVPTCAALLRGDAAQGFEPALRRLSPDEIRQWFAISLEAIAAELHKTPLRTVTPAQRRRATAELLDQASPDDRELLRSTLATPRVGTDDVACRGARVLYGGLLRLSERSRGVLSRALVAHQE